jgi:uncharacterized protein (TIGR00159 family)
VRDTIDIALVALGIYWLLILIRGTRAVQILVGLLLLIGTSLVSQAFELTTVEWILDNFLSSAVLIIIVLFQADIRRALARVGRGVFPSVARQEETQLAEEVARAAQSLAQKRVGALFVLERETHLSDLIEAGTAIDAVVKRDLLVSLFMPQSPLHDGAVVIQGGRIAQAGCILPLTLREDLPEGVGTRHRAAVGITEESDAVVIVVSEETQALSVVVGGVMARSLDGARLREVLRDVLAGGDGERRVMAELVGPRAASGDEPLGGTRSEATQGGRA